MTAPNNDEKSGSQVAKDAGLKTNLDEIGLAIVQEIYKAVDVLNGSACLLGTIGGWGDTLDDQDVLDNLKRHNEMGECFIPDVSVKGFKP